MDETPPLTSFDLPTDIELEPEPQPEPQPEPEPEPADPQPEAEAEPQPELPPVSEPELPAPPTHEFPYAECSEDACPLSEDCCLIVGHASDCSPTSHLIGAVVEQLRLRRSRPRSEQLHNRILALLDAVPNPTEPR
jgi:hypothetical protein